jgi:hypothetical protein
LSVASTILATTTLALAPDESDVKFAQGPKLKPKHCPAYWAKATAGFDFLGGRPGAPVDRPDGSEALSSRGAGGSAKDVAFLLR